MPEQSSIPGTTASSDAVGGSVAQCDPRPRLVVAITGATGVAFGVAVLRQLAGLDVETHLIVSRWGKTTLAMETDYRMSDITDLASHVHKPDDLAAAVASGSFAVDGMIVAPCSMKTLAAIRHGFSDDLIGRAADVTLKERRPLVLVVRETPLSAIHLDNMLALSRVGATIMPPVPALYARPITIEDIFKDTAARVLDQVGLHVADKPRWVGPPELLSTPTGRSRKAVR
jgi:4-hydroxy-3-polyprenylbenzoate decarboxylase